MSTDVREKFKQYFWTAYDYMNLLLYYVDVATDLWSLKVYREIPAPVSFAFLTFCFIVERVLTFFLYYVSVSGEIADAEGTVRKLTLRGKIFAFVRTFMLVLFFLDPIYTRFARPPSFKQAMRMRKLRANQLFLSGIMQTFLSILCVSNQIFQQALLRNDTAFNFLHFNMLVSCISFATRLTQYYIRRAKLARNHKYAKADRPFETLSEEEKSILFYPKLSVATTVELFRPHDVREVYNTQVRSTLKMKQKKIVWIWCMAFLTISCTGFAYGQFSILVMIPYFGIFKKTENRVAPAAFRLPLSSLFYEACATVLFNALLVIHSRGAYFRILKNAKTVVNQFGILMLMFWGLFLDSFCCMREFVPFYYDDPEIKENWSDNPLPQEFTIFWRLAISVFMAFFSRQGLYNYLQLPPAVTGQLDALRIVRLGEVLCALQVGVYGAHYFIGFMRNRYQKGRQRAASDECAKSTAREGAAVDIAAGAIASGDVEMAKHHLAVKIDAQSQMKGGLVQSKMLTASGAPLSQQHEMPIALALVGQLMSVAVKQDAAVSELVNKADQSDVEAPSEGDKKSVVMFESMQSPFASARKDLRLMSLEGIGSNNHLNSMSELSPRLDNLTIGAQPALSPRGKGFYFYSGNFAKPTLKPAPEDVDAQKNDNHSDSD